MGLGSLIAPQKPLTRLIVGWRCFKPGGYLLLGRVEDEVDTLVDVALESLDTLSQELLLLLGNTFQRVDGLLSTVGLCTS